MKVIDFHTHAFPDGLAARAMAHLEGSANVRGRHDGTIAGLVRCLDEAGIDRAVICSIATKPEQFNPILSWSEAIASDRLIPFPSVHPNDPDALDHIHAIRAAGFVGVKLHPYYQQFTLNEPRLMPLYEAIQEQNLILMCHTGFDMAFPRGRIGDPEKIAAVQEAFPRLKFIATHMGAWEDWDEVERLLVGKPIYLETSFSIGRLGHERARRMLLAHPQEYLIFGTDSPWGGQREDIEEIRALDLGAEREEALLYGNAERLLKETASR